VDLEDSRTIIHAFCKRLAPIDTVLHEPLHVTAIPILLGFVVPFIVSGTEDILPSLLGSIIQRIWEELVENKVEDEVYVDSIQYMFVSFL
jgi:hypothetical protein